MKELNQEQEDNWVRWITRNKHNGVSDPTLLKVMSDKGFEKDQAQSLLSTISSHPIFEASKQRAWRAKNLESLLNVQLELEYQNPENTKIERRSNLSNEEFQNLYYLSNKPVIITDLMDNWQAMKLWSPEYFRSKLGNMMIEIQSGRIGKPVYEVFLKGHTKKVTMKEYVDLVLSNSDTDEFYLTANDRLLENEEAKPILDDFYPFPEYLDPLNVNRKQFLWFGPKGAVSPLHRDRLNVFMTQVFGRKRVKLVSPYALHLVYNFESFFSEVDVENPDLERFPLFKKVKMIDLTLDPGEVLLIPVGWWHHVRSIDITISVSFTNFKLNNDFEDCFV